MIAPIVLFDDPRLTTRSTNLDLGNPEDAAAIRMVSQYAEMLTDVVVSAPMFGVNKRLILLRHNGRPIPLLNPVLVEARDFSFRDEMCWPGLPDLKLRVRRPEYVAIEAIRPDGEGQNAQVSGENARWLYWHLELLNGTAPAYRMTEFELYQAYRLQYFREHGWPFRLKSQMFSLIEKLSVTQDAKITFDGEYKFTIPSLNNLPGQSQFYEVDLRDPFACLSPADRTILHIFLTRHQNAPFSVFQVANPMLVVAANLFTPKDRVISVANETGQHVVQAFGDNTVEHKIPLVSNNLVNLGYREKTDAVFLDWYWADSSSEEVEADIRKISKKLSADGSAYLIIPSNLDKLEFAKSIMDKVFPKVSSRSLHGSDVLVGMRSLSAATDVLQRVEDVSPFPWHIS